LRHATTMFMQRYLTLENQLCVQDRRKLSMTRQPIIQTYGPSNI
jgi:hypothetical protein